MKNIYPKLLIIFMILLVSLILNFNYSETTTILPIKKEIEIKKIYIKDCDTLKKEIKIPTRKPLFNKYLRFRNIHKNSPVC